MSEAVLITGGGRGIGAATARLTAARGWPTVINYRGNASSAEAVRAEIAETGVKTAAIQADIADADEVVRLFDAAEAAVGPLKRVVVNAGVLFERMTLAEMAPDRIKRTVDVNVTGALYCLGEAARRLPEGGSIVVVSSVAARIGSANEFIDYAATKGGTDSMTLGLARELGPKGIRVNAVRPGLIETDIHIDAGWPERAQALGSNVPMGRAGSAAEVGEAIAWLLSDAASYVSGALLDVSGGR